MAINRNNTHLELMGSAEAFCYTTSLHVTHPKIIAPIINIRVKHKDGCHIQQSDHDTIAYGDFEVGDMLEVYSR